MIGDVREGTNEILVEGGIGRPHTGFVDGAATGFQLEDTIMFVEYPQFGAGVSFTGVGCGFIKAAVTT